MKAYNFLSTYDIKALASIGITVERTDDGDDMVGVSKVFDCWVPAHAPSENQKTIYMVMAQYRRSWVAFEVNGDAVMRILAIGPRMHPSTHLCCWLGLNRLY